MECRLLFFKPEQVAVFLNSRTFLEAYHMNKKHWLTIAFDETVEDSKIQEMLRECFDLVAKK